MAGWDRDVAREEEREERDETWRPRVTPGKRVTTSRLRARTEATTPAAYDETNNATSSAFTFDVSCGAAHPGAPHPGSAHSGAAAPGAQALEAEAITNCLELVNQAMAALALPRLAELSASSMQEAENRILAISPSRPIGAATWSLLDAAALSLLNVAQAFWTTTHASTPQEVARETNSIALLQAMDGLRSQHASGPTQGDLLVHPNRSVDAGGTRLNLEVGPHVQDQSIDRVAEVFADTNRLIGDRLPTPSEVDVELHRASARPSAGFDNGRHVMELGVNYISTRGQEQLSDSIIAHEYGHNIFTEVLAAHRPAGQSGFPNTQWLRAYNELFADVVAVLRESDPTAVSSALSSVDPHTEYRDFATDHRAAQSVQQLGATEASYSHTALAEVRSRVWDVYVFHAAQHSDVRRELIGAVGDACAQEAWNPANPSMSVQQVNQALLARLQRHSLFASAN